MSGETKGHLRVSGYIEQLQSRGRYTFSFDELSQAISGSDIALRSALRRLKKKGSLASPRRGFFLIVPVEYRSIGAPPASWFIDDLMSHLGQPYYVGLLSAAAIHGAAHQHPQVFQVVTNIPTSPMAAARVRIEFFRKRQIELIDTKREKTETGYMTVSSPEATVFDLIRHVRAAGHLNNVATVLAEMGEVISPDKLAASAAVASRPEVQRVGYLFQLVGREELTRTLSGVLASGRTRPALLRPDADIEGAPFDKRWCLFVNEEVEPDL